MWLSDSDVFALSDARKSVLLKLYHFSREQF